MAYLINVNGKVFLSISGSKPIALGISASGDAISFKASLQAAYVRVKSRLSEPQKIEFAMLMNTMMNSKNPLALVKSGMSKVARPSARSIKMIKEVRKLVKSGARPTITRPAVAAKESKPAKPTPKAKPMRIDPGVIRKALSGETGVKPVIEGLAKNPKNQEKLEKFLSAGKGNNRKRLVDSLFRTFLKIEKFSDAYDSIPMKEPKDLTLLRKAERGLLFSAVKTKPIEGLSPDEKLAMLRYYLYSYIPPGNLKYKEKLDQLNAGKALEAGDQNKARPLDASLLTAAAAYLWGMKKENDLAKLDLRSATPAVVTPPKAPEKVQPLRVAAIGDSITGETIEKDGKKIGLKTGYVAILESLLKKTAKDSVVDAFGVKGQESKDIAKRFAASLSGKGYNIVIIQGGVNDAYNYPKDQSKSKDIVDRVESSLKDMVKVARQLGIDPILLTIHPHTREGQTQIVKDRINEINKRIRAIAGARIVELPMLEGTLHPGSKGHEVIASLVMKELAERLKTAAAPTPVKEKKVEEYEREAQGMRGILSGFISGGAPERLRQLESTMPGKDILASIPDKYSRIKEEMLNLVCQSVFNMLKEKDYLTRFNAFLISQKGYEELFDIKGENARKVRAHADEEGTLFIERKGRKNTLAGKAQLIVKSLQEFLSNQYNSDLKFKRQIDSLYGDKSSLGPKRELRTDGRPDRALVYELATYSAWLAKQVPQKAMPQKTPEAKKVPLREL